MPTLFRPHGRAMSPALDEINRRIRLLMDEPADKRRTEEYTRLLVLWAEATAANGSGWCKAA
ncbi:hypothetical protein AB0B12_42670 [Streptomyces sp. NPDC044780]|uniref:Uncharacterized protein n=1 Tax=Streptomyces luomodiensis TaxID=3026192 RepID=A0ABY9USR1_9ACTN|nr:hypothetical protein [Streptomyces sp. SCA4-21]WNE95569.1 hypothetical protein PS467_09600 [Streptomyces sp. SCA4-21]